MALNPDRSKQAQEIIFSKKLKKQHNLLCFSTITMFPKLTLENILDVKLTFEEFLKNVFNKTSKIIGLLRELSNSLPRQALITTYEAFVRPHLD